LLRLVPLAVLVGVACGEDLESGAACPVLCPGQNLVLLDTTLDASIVIDTTLPGYPPLGSGPYLLAANSGDTLDARFVVRFDSLGTVFPATPEGTPISEIDSANVRIFVDSALSKATAPVTIEVYDVDTTAADTATAALLPLFRPDRLLGFRTFEVAALKDSVDIYISNDAVQAKIDADTALRLGFRVTSAEPVRLTVSSANTRARFSQLRYDARPSDATTGVLVIPPRSRTPVDDPARALDFFDYTVAATGAPTLPVDLLGVGGVRGRRVYFRFDLPARLTDSASIVRASLLLTQRPAPTYGFDDTLIVVPHVSLASAEVTDLARATLLTDTAATFGGLSLFGLPLVRLAPQDSGERRIEFVNVARFWNSESKTRVPQAIVLRSLVEGRSPIELRFFSTEAAASLRPRIRIVYVPRTEFGIP
jgi:hypothetical protein